MLDQPAGRHTAEPHDGEIEMMRQRLVELSAEVAKLIEVRSIQAARRAADAAARATDATRQTVVDYPLTSVAVGFAVGALIGVMVTREGTPSSPIRRIRDDLSSYADDLRASIARGVNQASMSDRFERMMTTLSSADAKETIAPTVDRVMKWFGQAKQQVKAVAETAAAKVS